MARSKKLNPVDEWVKYLNTKADAESTGIKSFKRKDTINAYTNGGGYIILPYATETVIKLPAKESNGKTDTSRVIDGKVYNKFRIRMKVVFEGKALE